MLISISIVYVKNLHHQWAVSDSRKYKTIKKIFLVTNTFWQTFTPVFIESNCLLSTEKSDELHESCSYDIFSYLY